MTILKLPRKVYQKHRTRKEKFFFGTVIDEVYINQRSKAQRADYKKMLQLIEKADKSREIRLCYYVKDSGRSEKDYRWGSQTTFQIDVKNFKKLLSKAKQKGIL